MTASKNKVQQHAKTYRHSGRVASLSQFVLHHYPVIASGNGNAIFEIEQNGVEQGWLDITHGDNSGWVPDGPGGIRGSWKTRLTSIPQNPFRVRLSLWDANGRLIRIHNTWTIDPVISGARLDRDDRVIGDDYHLDMNAEVNPLMRNPYAPWNYSLALTRIPLGTHIHQIDSDGSTRDITFPGTWNADQNIYTLGPRNYNEPLNLRFVYPPNYPTRFRSALNLRPSTTNFTVDASAPEAPVDSRPSVPSEYAPRTPETPTGVRPVDVPLEYAPRPPDVFVTTPVSPETTPVATETPTRLIFTIEYARPIGFTPRPVENPPRYRVLVDGLDAAITGNDLFATTYALAVTPETDHTLSVVRLSTGLEIRPLGGSLWVRRGQDFSITVRLNTNDTFETYQISDSSKGNIAFSSPSSDEVSETPTEFRPPSEREPLPPLPTPPPPPPPPPQVLTGSLHVILRNRPNVDITASQGETIIHQTTNTVGEATFSDLAIGEWNISVEGSSPTRITVSQGQASRLEITGNPTGSPAGTLVVRGVGSNGQVVLIPASGQRASSDGWKFENVNPGDYVVHLRWNTGIEQNFNLHIDAGTTVDLGYTQPIIREEPSLMTGLLAVAAGTAAVWLIEKSRK